MWVLRKGRLIRVDIYTDPCWSTAELWSMRTMYCRFRCEGMSHTDAMSLASVKLWKTKWAGTRYIDRVERALQNATMF